MTPARYAFIQASWHSNIVNQALVGFQKIISSEHLDVFTVPGAFEMPLLAANLARTGKYDVITAAAFVVDGGIYRHEFVAQAVVDGLMKVGLETGIPVLSVSLTPHSYQETDEHIAFFMKHFIMKGIEAAEAAILLSKLKIEVTT